MQRHQMHVLRRVDNPPRKVMGINTMVRCWQQNTAPACQPQEEAYIHSAGAVDCPFSQVVALKIKQL